MAILSIGIMYAAFLVVGCFASRKVKDGTPADLIVAGRSMPLWIATLTMTATWVDGGYLLDAISLQDAGCSGGNGAPSDCIAFDRALESSAPLRNVAAHE
jgi:hypothetical protein